MDFRDRTTLLLLAGGAGLIWLSFLIPYVNGGRIHWNDSLANRLQEASASYHDAFHARIHQPAQSGKDADEMPAGERGVDELAARSAREYQELNRRLARVQSGGNWVGTIARIAGFLLVAAGVGREWWQRSKAGS